MELNGVEEFQSVIDSGIVILPGNALESSVRSIPGFFYGRRGRIDARDLWEQMNTPAAT